MVALIDGDSILYRQGFAFETDVVWNEFDIKAGADTDPDVMTITDFELAIEAIVAMVEAIKIRTSCEDIVFVITGDNNFRYTVMPEYKANRATTRRPKMLTDIKAWVKTYFNTVETDGYEADDYVVALKNLRPDDYTVCAIDKDVLYQCVGTHYNYIKDEFVTISTYNEVLYFKYLQILAGDPTDGYSGIPKVGMVKAKKILGELNTTKPATEYEAELDAKAQEAYKKAGVYNTYYATKQVATIGDITLSL